MLWEVSIKLAPKVIIADANEDLPDGEIPGGDTLDLSEEVDASVASTIGKKLIKKFGKKFVTADCKIKLNTVPIQ